MTHRFPIRRPPASACLVLPLAAAALWATPAAAHAVLVSSTPPLGGAIAAGHQHLLFRFNSRIDHEHSRLMLTGPDGRSLVLPIEAASAENALETEADLAPGGYRLRWQALALDGHVTRGDVPFTVPAPPPAASAGAPPTP